MTNRISGLPKPSPIVPIFLFRHLTGEFVPGKPLIKGLDLLGVRNCPEDLAQAFLTFISDDTAPYTDEELAQVTRVIANIYERCYGKFR